MEAVATKKEVTEGKFLTFVLNNEEYGIEILKVREIIGLMNITTVPQTLDYMKGIINLRGKIIPVIDLRLKFSMPEEEHTQETCVIVAEVNNTSIGIIVDSVSEGVGHQEWRDRSNTKFRTGDRYRLYYGHGQNEGKDNNST